MSIYKNGKLVAGGRQCMPLLSFMWSDHILNDASWLRADTFSWHTGSSTTGVYQAAYQHLIDDMVLGYGWTVTIAGTTLNTWTKSANPSVGDNIYTIDGAVAGVITSVSFNFIEALGYTFGRAPGLNAYLNKRTETVAGTTITFYLADDGHKICPASEESNVMAIYNATGVAWYYIIDTTNQRFKLPRTKFGFTGLRDTVGNYIEPGLPNITGAWASQYNISLDNNSQCIGAIESTYSTGQGYYGGSGAAAEWGYGFNFNASRSNSIYGNSDTVQTKATQMYLYFYVGNFTQTALENTAGVTTEVLNGKADKDDAVGYCSYNTNTRIPVTTTAQTATKNGWLIGSVWFSGNNVYLAIIVNGIEIIRSPWANGTNWSTVNVSIPLKAGQTYQYYGNGTVEQNHLYFYPND